MDYVDMVCHCTVHSAECGVPTNTDIKQPSMDELIFLHNCSLLLNLPATQTNRLQLVLNSAARAVTETPKFHHITPILKLSTGSR